MIQRNLTTESRGDPEIVGEGALELQRYPASHYSHAVDRIDERFGVGT
jgi:hypothetical protein